MYLRMGRIESDIRSIKQTQEETVIPDIEALQSEVRQLRARFVYALTMIGSAIGAVAYLVLRGGLL